MGKWKPWLGLTIALILVLPFNSVAFDLNLKGSLKDGGHSHYVPPVSNPIFNETPFMTTEVRPVYYYTDIPSQFITGGGNIQLVAAQVRVALNERLAVIATKDGYADLDFDGVLRDEDGFANIAFGLKYALIDRPEDDAILTAGVTYEPPSGNLVTSGIYMQGTADGFVNVFASGAKAFGNLGLQANGGFNLAVDQAANTSMFHFSAHADYEVLDNLFPLVEINTFSVIDDATRTAVGFEGLDTVNFGATGAGTVATFAVGARYKFLNHFMAGFSYEFPMTGREDIIDWRTTADLVIYY